MAELLIYNRDHWSDGVSSIISSNWDVKVIEKTTKVYEKGDIVEVRTDGYWSKEHGWRKDCFALLKLSGVSVKAVEHYMQSIIDSDGNITKKRRYNISTIDFSLLKEQSAESVSVYDKEAKAALVG